MGYCFLNFRTSKALVRFRDEFHGRQSHSGSEGLDVWAEGRHLTDKLDQRSVPKCCKPPRTNSGFRWGHDRAVLGLCMMLADLQGSVFYVSWQFCCDSTFFQFQLLLFFLICPTLSNPPFRCFKMPSITRFLQGNRNCWTIPTWRT